MLNHEQMLKMLVGFGLTEIDSEIYLLLCRKRLQMGRSIAEELNLAKQQFNRSLRHLLEKGMVTSTLERPARFSAVPLGKVLEVMIEAKKEQALALQANRKVLLSSWRSIIKKDSSES